MTNALTTGDANVTNSIELLLGKEHADISYLKKDKISSVLSKALSETYRLQPNDPVQFFASYLMNHNKTLELVYQNQANESKITDLKQKHQSAQDEVAAKKQEKEVDKKQAQTKVDQFFEKIEQSADLNENLQELADFLEEQSGATGVYVGRLVFPKKPIEDDAADNAHFDDEAPKVIQFSHATNSHAYMVDQVLEPESGPLTHSVFGEQEEEEPAEEEEGEAPKKSTDILDTFKHKFVKEVVREPKMWFKRVPRLGSYMAVPLIYQSCLSDEALEAAVADYQDVTARKAELQKEVDQHEEEQAARKDAAEQSGEQFEAEERDCPVIEFADFICQEQKFVVCLDTMG
jgi:hypothetical protein